MKKQKNNKALTPSRKLPKPPKNYQNLVKTTKLPETLTPKLTVI